MNAPVSARAFDAQAVLARAARAPRYTSYPTANHFSAAVGPELYDTWLAALPEEASLSLYMHVPFCDQMCWYCACTTKATKRYTPIAAYLDTLEAEMARIAEKLPAFHRVRHIHLGGGSPDILSPEDMLRLGERLHTLFRIDPDAEFAIEIDPRLMTEAKADSLAAIGVNRISVGVQDFDVSVQAAIGRMQSFEETRAAVAMFRARGITSINLDLVYGLPHQTLETVMATLDRALELSPDRIALFGYAHLPQRAANQRLIDEAALPDLNARYGLSCALSRALTEAGFMALGVDHFAKATDKLAKAPLKRNFQGYTTDDADALIGMGASSISRLPQGFAQNATGARDYAERIAAGGLATVRGAALTADDRVRATAISALMCDFTFDGQALTDGFGEAAADVIAIAEQLLAQDQDGLLERTDEGFRLTDAGRPFVRIVCAAFDAYLSPDPAARRHASAI